MKRLFLILSLSGCLLTSQAQEGSILHEGNFKTRKIGMSSNPYKPADWEKRYYDSAVKTVFPSDLNRSPEKYKARLIHLIGIVDSVYLDSFTINIVLENKYWDYIEDYSIQDEVMFVSPKGDGKFMVTLPKTTADEVEVVNRFRAEKKLLLVYGNFIHTLGGIPALDAVQIKYIDYKWYSTNIFSYEVKRNKNGEVEVNKKGKLTMDNFSFIKVAHAGQNK